MKKLLIILGLFVTVFSYGQISIAGVGAVASSGGSATPTYTAEYQAVLDDWTTDPTGDTLTYDNAMVYSLDTAGLWDKANVIYVTAIQTNAAGEAYVNWKNPGTHDITDPSSTAPAFGRYEGFTGDGASDFLSLNYNTVDDGSANMATDSITVSVYCRANITYETGAVIGNDDGADEVAILPLYTASDLLFIRLNSSSAYQHDDLSISYGMFTGVRDDNANITGYTNGVLDQDRAVASTGEVGVDFYILASNNNGGTPQFFSTNQVAFVWIGEKLTATEVGYLNTIVETRMDAVGKGVQ